jgi:uncharacterized membrane protein (UPF0136 family)
MMRTIGWLVAVYGLLIAAGGVFGYVQAASVASLLAGALGGGLLLVASVGLFRGKRWGLLASALLVGIFDTFFLVRFFKTRAFFPSGLFSLLSLLVLAALFLRMRKSLSS